MTSFLAIVKLTCRSAVRSNVFRFLLFLLIVCVILVPNTIKGDGTAYGYIQVMLEYSTGIVALILSSSIIWLSCSEFCTDMENGRIHMIFVKPVSRIVVWLGKFTGVFLIHLVLLLISFLFIYLFVMFQYNRQKFSPEERARMENEVFAGDEDFVVKLNNFAYAGDDLTHFFIRIEAHNRFFGNVPYDLIGFAYNGEQEFCAVLVQPYVQAKREATEQEIQHYMQSLGFVMDYVDEYHNETYEIFDAVPNNVLCGIDNQLYFIDTQIRMRR